MEQRSVCTVSSVNGDFEFPSRPPQVPDRPSVIWVTLPGYSAQRLLFTGGPSLVELPNIIEMVPTGDLLATVVTSIGTPIAGARVIQLTYLGKEDPSLGNDLDRRALGALYRTYYTDSSGQAHLPTFPGISWVRAETDQFRSIPWSGHAPCSFQLRIAETFSVRGEVFSPPAITSMERTLCVRSSIRDGADLRTLMRTQVRSDGSWGPIELPAQANSSYLFELEGFDLTHEVVSLQSAQPGTMSNIDFHPQVALHTSVRVIDQVGIAITEAIVEATWNAQDAWHTVSASTNGSGIAELGGLENGPTSFTAKAHGFAQSSIDVELPTSQQSPIELRLGPAGSIQGTCQYHGQPVPSFSIHWWQGQDFRGDNQTFSPAPDGHYLIADAPEGEVWIIASSPLHAQSPAVRVAVKPGELTTANVELQDELVGHGTAIDGVSSKPIAGAVAQLYSHYRGTRIHVARAPALADSGGVFELPGVAIGMNVFEVTAPGYQSAEVVRECTREMGADLGIVPLFPRQALNVTLLSSDREDVTQFRVALLGDVEFPERPFDEHGHVQFENIDPGKYTLRVLHPGDLSYDDIRVDVIPGHDSEVRVPLQSQEMSVDVIPPLHQTTIPDGLVLRVRQGHSDDTLSTDHVYGIPSNGHVTIRAVEGDIAIDVLQLDRTCRGFTHAYVTAGSPHAIRVAIDTNPVEFRVVDQSKTEFPNALVGVFCLPDCANWYTQGVSDQFGVCRFVGLTIDTAFVNVGRLPEGFMPAVRMSLRTPTEEPIELRLAPDCLLHVLALERGRPIPGLQLEAFDAHVPASLGLASTDERGEAQFCRVGRGQWLVSLFHPGYWRDQFLVPASCDEQPYPIEVRQVGGIEMEVKDHSGRGSPYLPINFYSEEKDRWVSDWIEEGRVSSPQQGLTTDLAGRVRVLGLPNGAFRWTATLPDGSSLDGHESVPPHGMATVTVTIP